MVYNPFEKNWATIHCPVCRERLGTKLKTELKSFECSTEGCSKTKHYFYPGEIKRPGKSIPWASYYDKKNKCGKPCCDPPTI